MKTLLTLAVAFTSVCFSQQISGEELLEKAIRYHDPNNNWPSFNDTLFITMKTPKSANRDSEIIINLPKEYFYVKAKRDTITTEYVVTKNACIISLNGSDIISDSELKDHNLSCERANLYKNYYTYLYGLPMKLKDEGTIVSPNVEETVFRGKRYLVLNVSYEASVGSDLWRFYFNHETYAMEVYQFYKTDEQGTIKKDSGEYILLSDIEVISNIKMPKIRKWYYNKDNGYLGSDILKH